MYTPLTLNTTSPLNPAVPQFRLSDHTRKSRSLDEMMGTYGLLLAFVGDIWQPTAVQRVFGLQNTAPKVARLGCPIAVVVHSRVNTLASFMLSSPLPIPFPLLADPDGTTYANYKTTNSAALLLLDRDRLPRYRWSLTGKQPLPPTDEMIYAVQMLNERMQGRDAQ